MKTTNQSVVTYQAHMGNDLSVVNAARVSHNKKSNELCEKDLNLLNFLAKHNHFTPFTHTSITLTIECPIFVRTQLFKHKVGLTENEISRRYVTDEPVFFIPDELRVRPCNIKQGSTKGSVHSLNEYYKQSMTEVCEQSLQLYNTMVANGVAPEQARSILPQNTMTMFYWTGNLMSFYRVYKLRSAADSQIETQEVANQIKDIMLRLYPNAWNALLNV